MSATNYTVCVLGDNHSGKTSFVSKYSLGQLLGESDDEDDNVSGIDEWFTRNVTVDNLDYKLDILATGGGGSDSFIATEHPEIRQYDCIVICYSITSKPTFEDVMIIHDRTLRNLEQGRPQPLLVLVGNKADLEEERQVSKEEAGSLSATLNFDLFFECSAKNGFNLDECFGSIVRRLDARKPVLTTVDESDEEDGSDKEEEEEEEEEEEQQQQQQQQLQQQGAPITSSHSRTLSRVSSKKSSIRKPTSDESKCCIIV